MTMTMNRDDDFNDPRAWVNGALLDAVNQVRRRLSENVALVRAADPEGTLHELAKILAVKRGCKR